jgi:hypothetical protein
MKDPHGIEVSTRRKLAFLHRADGYLGMIGRNLEVVETLPGAAQPEVTVDPSILSLI